MRSATICEDYSQVTFSKAHCHHQSVQNSDYKDFMLESQNSRHNSHKFDRPYTPLLDDISTKKSNEELDKIVKLSVSRITQSSRDRLCLG